MSKITFLGSGNTLLSLIPFVFKKTNYEKVLVGYSPRHAKSLVNKSETFEQKLEFLANKYQKLSLYCIESLDVSEYEILCDSEIQISLGSPWIFKQKDIDKAPYLVHSHCTDLPRYRGGASTSWMLMSKYNKAAITIFRMNTGIDAGDLILKKNIIFPKNFSTPKEYDEFIEKRLFKQLKKFILDYQKTNHKKKEIRQDDSKSIYFPRLSSEVNSWINWNWSCHEIVQFIKAFSDPYGGAKTRVNKSKNLIIKIKKAKINQKDEGFHPFKNGLIYRIHDNKIYVACAPFSLEISKEFIEINNSELKVGDRLFTLSTDIDEAMSKRIFYLPK